MTMKVSVIIPTAREGRAQSTVDYLWRTTLNDLDIVVSSPGFKINGAKNIEDGMVGSSRAIADAFAYTDPDSEYIAWLSDICLPTGDIMDCSMRFMETAPLPFIAEFMTSIYTTARTYRVCTITGKQYARWGILSRATIEKIGGFFDPRYSCFFGDVDLSLRCWKAGGHVATCEHAVIIMDGQRDDITVSNWEKARAADRALFLDRWAIDYPVMREQDDSVWNVDKVLTRSQ